MQNQAPPFVFSTHASASSESRWHTSTVLLLRQLPLRIDSTSCNPSPSSSTPLSNRDSGLGSIASNSSSSISFYPPLSPNAIAFSIENLLNLSTPKEEPSFTQLWRPLQPLNLSTSSFPRSRPYSCRYCSKTYSSRSSVRLHEATHTMPFHCPECGRRFSRLWLLESHRRIHTGERPFVCSVCTRRFADRSNMRAHKRTHRHQ